jgi:predicted alpha/beta hydrolase
LTAASAQEERSDAPAADGYPLAVTRFAAKGLPWCTMAIAGAMGVRQDFYHPIARFFAENGCHVLTFDYRGMGWSRREPLTRFDVSVVDWAAKDLNAMLHEARRPAPHLPLVLLGHSLGGQIIGIAPDHAQVAAAIAVTAGSGFYRLNRKMRVEVRALWFAIMPVLTSLFGYFPGKRLRMVGDLPRGVAWQWRRWCLHPEYLLSEGPQMKASYARFAAPILSYSFDDDPMITAEAVDSLNAFYRNARFTRRHVVPAEIGEKGVGHFGYFAERSRATLWAESLDWARAQVPHATLSRQPRGSPCAQPNTSA